MMNRLLATIGLTCIGSTSLIVACTINTTNNGDTDGGVTNPDAANGSDSPTGDDSGDASVEAEAAPPPMTSVRIAHLSPDAAAIDFCVAVHGTTTFVGPMLAQLAADAGTSGAAGLAYAQVTTYVSIAPGQYDVRLVAAGATDCTTMLVPDTTTLPTLAPDAFTTIAAVGDFSPAGSDPGLSLKAFTDDSTAASGQVGLRFLHAVPSLPSLDVGTGSIATADFLTLFGGVTFGTTDSQAGSDAGTIDTNGYLAITPPTAGTISAHTTVGATSDAVKAPNVTLASGATATMIAIGAKTGDSAHPLQLLLCVDNGVNATGSYLAACSVASQ